MRFDATEHMYGTDPHLPHLEQLLEDARREHVAVDRVFHVTTLPPTRNAAQFTADARRLTVVIPCPLAEVDTHPWSDGAMRPGVPTPYDRWTHAQVPPIPSWLVDL